MKIKKKETQSRCTRVARENTQRATAEIQSRTELLPPLQLNVMYDRDPTEHETL